MKLRNITIQEQNYLYRVRFKRPVQGNSAAVSTKPEFTVLCELYICAKDHPNTALHINFLTWEDATGSPLSQGYPLNLADKNDPCINLHRPYWIAQLITLALAKGWEPKHTKMCVADGLPWLSLIAK